MRSKNVRVILFGLGIGLMLAASGCATAKFGKADLTVFDIKTPAGLVGQDRAGVMKILGDPDMVLSDQGLEYWGYKNKIGWYIYLYYVAGGKTEVKDLIVEFMGDTVKTAYLVDKGSAVGIFMPPQSIAN